MNLLVRCGAVVAALPIVVPAAVAQLPPVRGFPADALPQPSRLERDLSAL